MGKVGIGGPAHLGFDGLVHFVLEIGVAQAESGERSKEESAHVRPMRDSRIGAKQRTGKDLHEQPQRQKPVRCRLKSDSPAQGQVREAAKSKDQGHFDFGFRESHQKRAHERSNRARGAERRNNTARVRPGVELQCCDSGSKVRDGIDDATPGVFQDRAGEPQEPDIPD